MDFSLTIVVAIKSLGKAPAGLISGEGLFPVSWVTPSHCVLIWQKRKGVSYFIRTLIPLRRVLSSRSNHLPDVLPSNSIKVRIMNIWI